MKTTRSYIALAAALVLWTSLAQGAAPIVTNVIAAQRFGTKLVDIIYDITADLSPVTITLEISSDAGVTYAVPAATVSGAVGAGVLLGSGKTITWNAGSDWNEQTSAQMRFRVTANDSGGFPPPPSGFVLVPAGSFQMGGQSDTPVHTVQVSTFYMATTEVTKAVWDEVYSWGVANGYWFDSYQPIGKAPDHPVVRVTWYDVVKWCNARSQKEGVTPCYTVNGAVMKTGMVTPVCNWNVNGYRIPTEAEWEKAARGGVSGQRFPWGNTITHSQANYYSSSSYSYDVSPTRGYHPAYAVGSSPYTSPVGSFAPNGYGLYDMAGNVAEWCWDWYGAYTADTQTDPRGPGSGSYRISRGGNWGYWGASVEGCLVTKRMANTSTVLNDSSLGFRLARSAVR